MIIFGDTFFLPVIPLWLINHDVCNLYVFGNACSPLDGKILCLVCHADDTALPFKTESPLEYVRA